MKKLYYHENSNSKFSKPRSPYLTSLSELSKWKAENDEFNVAKVDLRERPTFRNDDTQKDKRDCQVVVCHDMAGGYIESFFKIGYSIQYWQYIDIFIYFSHHRITIPPPQWTNAAHRNGVKVLGTFITEWVRDMLENELWVRGPHTKAPLDDSENVDRRIVSTVFADKLVSMAMYYNFDGWFINIESPLIGGSLHAHQVITFMNYLTQQMHKHKPGSVVLWYDSITKEGTLAWQDHLNDLNYPFFDVTDGIFVNYTWSEEYPELSAQKAGSRKRNVYTGIDIWGRNTYGDGGFTTYKALKVIQKAKTSCALFAPAWTYEHLGKEAFWDNDKKFWIGSADKYEDVDSQTDRKSEDEGLAIAHYIVPRYSPGINNFYTNFDRGCGYKFFIKGLSVLEQEWAHLSHQSIQPFPTKRISEVISNNASEMSTNISHDIAWNLTFNKAYNGGTSVVVYTTAGHDEAKTKIYMLPLYDLNINISPHGYTRARVTYLPEHRGIVVGLYLKVGFDRNIKDGGQIAFNLDTKSTTRRESEDQKISFITLSNENYVDERSESGSQYLPLQKFKTTTVSMSHNWITTEVLIPPNTFSISPTSSLSDLVVQELGVSIISPPYAGKSDIAQSSNVSTLVHIGQLSVSSTTLPSRLPEPEVQNLFWQDNTLIIENLNHRGILRISGIIEWEMGVKVVGHTGEDRHITQDNSDVEIPNSFGYYYVYAEIDSASLSGKPSFEKLTFLGIADVSRFMVSGLEIPVSNIMKDTILTIWVQGVRESTGEGVEYEKWKKCSIPLFYYTTKVGGFWKQTHTAILKFLRILVPCCGLF
ncbi:glycoside hydrolase [Gigaspora margarita]|uniref:Glycoside hydrolase n=1 Tax=Gigaspora margarita TaxID=4874 RepID=A0A8H3X6Y7_GIGMA|nr:glycoside hydrolase [Gigaspora margarita]